MKPENKNPNAYELYACLRETNVDLTIAQTPNVLNLVTIANELAKSLKAEELIKLVEGKPAQVIQAVYSLNRERRLVDGYDLDLNCAIARDPRMNLTLATLLDGFTDNEQESESNLASGFRGVFAHAGEIIQQDIFYIASELEKINYDIFQTESELPF